MELVKKGGVREEAVYKCPHDGATRTSPGPCPKCGMMLDERHRVKVEPPAPIVAPKPAQERKIYVCDVHPESVSDAPGQCFKGG